MHNILVVHILDALDYLAHEDGANLFGELKVVVDDALKEFAAVDPVVRLCKVVVAMQVSS